MDVLSHGRRRPVAAIVAAALVLGGCGGGHAVSQRTLPPAKPVPVPTVATTTAAPESPEPGVGNQPEAEGPADTPASDGARGVISGPGQASFARLQAQLGGQIGVAVSGIGLGRPVQTLGSLQSAVAWSTSKVPIAMAIYAAGLANSQQQNLNAAITASDNAAAERLWDALGGGQQAARAADAQLRAAGDLNTSIQPATLRAGYTPFGQTVWSLADQTRFTAGMACLQAGGMVLGLMDQIVAGERWGLGAAGVSAQFKGGWGPGFQPGVNGGYLDRQTGIVTVRGTPVAISIAAMPSDGSHTSGTSDLTAIARWAVANMHVRGLPRRASCG